MKRFYFNFRLLWMFIRLNIIVLYRTLRNRTVPKLFRQTARKYPKKIAFHCEEKTWTFEQVSQSVKLTYMYHKYSHLLQNGEKLRFLLFQS